MEAIDKTTVSAEEDVIRLLSADVILLDVRFHLLKLSTLEKYELNESQFTSNTAQNTN
ncbi:MAG: hypothetical protein IKQ59_01745 [Prevotella sp.]|nr:hypothetical protein [Prevotella sp.]